jgi:hypothetical protein
MPGRYLEILKIYKYVLPDAPCPAVTWAMLAAIVGAYFLKALVQVVQAVGVEWLAACGLIFVYLISMNVRPFGRILLIPPLCRRVLYFIRDHPRVYPHCLTAVCILCFLPRPLAGAFALTFCSLRALRLSNNFQTSDAIYQ